MKILLPLAIIAMMTLVACDKDDINEDETTIQTYQPGFGGEGEISAYVRYNDDLMSRARIYIKFGVDTFGTDTTMYDTLKICGSSGHGLGHSHIQPMHQGTYYLYAVAFDSVSMTEKTGYKTVVLESETDHEESNITLH